MSEVSKAGNGSRHPSPPCLGDETRSRETNETNDQLRSYDIESVRVRQSKSVLRTLKRLLHPVDTLGELRCRNFHDDVTAAYGGVYQCRICWRKYASPYS